jgi:hypothetical protein
MLKTESTVAPKMYMMDCASWFPGHALQREGEKEGRSRRVRVCACVYSPASVAEGKVEGIGLRGLAGLSDQAIRVESHRVLVYLGVMHEVPISRFVSKARTRAS